MMAMAEPRIPSSSTGAEESKKRPSLETTDKKKKKKEDDTPSKRRRKAARNVLKETLKKEKEKEKEKETETEEAADAEGAKLAAQAAGGAKVKAPVTGTAAKEVPTSRHIMFKASADVAATVVPPPTTDITELAGMPIRLQIEFSPQAMVRMLETAKKMAEVLAEMRVRGVWMCCVLCVCVCVFVSVCLSLPFFLLVHVTFRMTLIDLSTSFCPIINRRR